MIRRNTYTPTPSKSQAGTVPALKALSWKINPTFAFMPSPSFPPALLFVVVWPPNSDHFQTQVEMAPHPIGELMGNPPALKEP